MKKKHLLFGLVGVLTAVCCVACSGGDDKDKGDKEDSWVTGLKSEMGVVEPSGTLTKVSSRVGVHDPSIEYDPSTGTYYIFGSHTDFAKSKDLINWTKFSQNNAKTYGAIFAKNGEWSKHGNARYSINGNLWAPDVIYNHDMKKWCMYMTINGDNYYSSIALATADNIEGPYTYVDTIIYSGFTNESEVAETDYEKVTGEKTPADRYLKADGKWNNTYGTNAIDPCVLYDKDGQLWMVYGSWFGGLFMIKLDNETGLRDYTYTFETEKDVSDQYLGKRLSGGYGGTGEGPYIVWDEEAGYYFMYASYCGLNATDGFSGYHMRLFRSENIDGPYVDVAGDDAVRSKPNDNQAEKGIKIMGNYFFSSLTTSGAGKAGYMSPGHNSALVDDNGNRYVIYHTRFNTGTEAHQVRVHQQFLNEDKWLVTAPYEYLGSKISETGYDEAEIVGSYEFVDHGKTVPNGIKAPMLETLEIELNADHTITGDKTGTWEQKEGTYYATLVIDGVTYKGVFFKQFDESENHTETMTFTVVGENDLALWGSKDMMGHVPDEGDLIANYQFEDAANAGKDSAGTVGDATVSGGAAVVTDDERGNVLSFDGVDDYLELSSKVVGHEGFTVMMWFKGDKNKDWERLFDFGDDTFVNTFIATGNDSGKLIFTHTLDGDAVSLIGEKSAKNKWTHVALTVNSTTKRATVYVNGEKIGKVVLDEATENFEGKANYIGKSRYSSDPLFAGCMDDIYIFDYALSDDEVVDYMNK